MISDDDGEPEESRGNDLHAVSWDSAYHHSPFVRELWRLKELKDYRRRGYDFEEFAASLFRRRHFRVVLSPGTARPRQTDLLATRGGDAYLIETKWRSSRANINDIDSLFSRLEAAPSAIVGLMISFSGFTASAIEKVEQRSERPVLLITGDELEQLVYWDEDVVHLLSRKKAFLLTHRKALFVTSRRQRSSTPPDRLAAALTEFVFPDGRRAKWIAGQGDFGEFTFVQELPDIDWDPVDGRGVTLDMPVPIHDEGDILSLLQHLSNMGWASDCARWNIQQSSINWHGLGASEFAEALTGWQERHEGIPTHHSEEFCYFDKCDDGFYCLTANISAHEDRSTRYAMLSFQLTGIPLDIDSYKELSRTFDIGYQCYFRPMKRRSVKRKWNLADPYRIPLEPVAFLVEKDRIFNDDREWTRGIAAKNPFYSPESTLAERKPHWLPSHIFDSELLICDLRSWHPLTDPPPSYELWGCESARTADAVIVRPIAEWLSPARGPASEVPPRRARRTSEL